MNPPITKANPKAGAPNKNEAAAKQATLKVLLVDDHPPVRQLVRDLLEALSNIVQIEECGNGAEAVAASHRYEPDCIVMDIQMPVLDGLQAAARIQAQGVHRHIIILSSYDNPELRAAARGAGAEAYVLKDNLADLLTLVRPLLQSNS